MAQASIYADIANRTNGDIYIGVVGPVRTGKSTFIKKFMDTLVIPNIGDEALQSRTVDELPQSAAGRTIMTTEPKFIPEEAVTVNLPENASFKVRLIDCVGYIVPGAIGYIEDNEPRMVHTPWYEEEIPFDTAAEIGTKKVINEHSTVGLVITTDGSITDIPRDEYELAEQRVIDELKELEKPFVILLNCAHPESESAKELSNELSERYAVPVLAVNCLEMNEGEIKEILTQLLFEFPIKQVSISLPCWLDTLSGEHWLKKSITDCVKYAADDLKLVRDISILRSRLEDGEYVSASAIREMNLGDGSAVMTLTLENGLFYKIIEEQTGMSVENDEQLMELIVSLGTAKKEYDKIKYALDEVESTGYGIIMPDIEELSLKEPEIIKQGGRYGVKLSASAPSIHMLKANIQTEVAPIVGTESQSEELIKYLLEGFEEEPTKIWESNIFGKSLNELVNEGVKNKLFHMPNEARMKLQETLERVINEGCNGLICIII